MYFVQYLDPLLWDGCGLVPLAGIDKDVDRASYARGLLLEPWPDHHPLELLLAVAVRHVADQTAGRLRWGEHAQLVGKAGPTHFSKAKAYQVHLETNEGWCAFASAVCVIEIPMRIAHLTR